MKHLFVSAALLPLALASGARAETKIPTAVTTPVKTSTAAAGSPDSLTIDTTGSVKPTVAGVAVTLDSNNTVTNKGAIGFNNLNGATGVLVLGGRTGSVINTGSISVSEDVTAPDTDKDGFPDGPAAQGSARFGVRVTGPGAFTGDIRNDAGGTITVKGNDSAGISVGTQLTGNLVNAGSIAVTGDRSLGVSAQHVTGDVRVTGSVSVIGDAASAVVLGDVDGGVRLQNSISSTGYKTTQRLADADRAKLDADDLRQGGSTVRIAGSVAKGVLLDKPPSDKDPKNADEDADGVPDAQEGTAVLTSFGAAPALDIGAAQATTLGAVGTGDNAFGLVIKGQVSGQGVNDGVGATAVRIGQSGGGATAVTGGINNLGGTISATAFGADVKANGGDATALLINPGAAVASLRNSGSITATLTGGSQDARAVVDRSGSLSLVENTGVIGATVAPKTGSANLGHAIALDLSANTTGAIVRQTLATATSAPAIVGDVLFGSGADQLLLSGGSLNGNVAFGAGADFLRLDGGSRFTGKITDSDGKLGVLVQDGRLALAGLSTLQVTSLVVGPKGVLAFNIDPATNSTTRFDVVAGGASFADGAQIQITLTSVLKSQQTFELVHAALVQQGSVGTTLLGAPFLFTAKLKADINSLSVDIRPKTAIELGLNRSGAQAYSAVFADFSRDPALQNAVLAQTSKAGFQSLYDQLLPDHSGGALSSAQAISAGISQAVGQALPHDGQGGGAVWAQEIAFHIDQDREQALGFTSEGYGLAAGVESVGETNAIGLDASFVTTTYKDRGAAAGERVVMNFTEGGAYWRLRRGALQVDARAGLGYVWLDSNRRLAAPGVGLTSTASWTGWLVDAHAGASYLLRAGSFYARPELSLDYLRLNEDGYQEKGGGAAFDLKVDSRDGDLLTGQALVAFGWEFGEEDWWAPELKLGWREKLSGGPGATTARFSAGPAFTLDPEDPVSGGAVARVGLRGGSDQMFMAIDAGGTFDKHAREYDVRGTIRFRF